MSVAAFNPPISATSEVDGLPRIVIGVISPEVSGSSLRFIAIGTEGEPEVLSIGQFKFDFRWDDRERDWINPAEVDLGDE